MKRLFSYLAVIGVLLLLISSVYFIFESRSFTLRSKANVTVVSGPNTYCFGTPSCVKAGGEESISFTCFCNSHRGLPVPNMAVKIESDADISVKAIQGITDENGQSTYYITAEKPGVYQADVYCGDTLVSSAQNLCFE